MSSPVLHNGSRRRVGRYLICGQMAAGGMASVHLGRLIGPVGFSKIVAIKRLHQRFASDPEFLEMFIDEARLASAIRHPNVVSSLDVVCEDGELLLIMEYVQGETLAQLSKLARQRKEAPALGIVQRILCDTLDGLHAAHTAGVGGRALNIVHRDVSPQNIMVAANGVARVLDFGIAKAASRTHNTAAGKVKGKFAYLSPEQLRGVPVDARTDVFSAGVVLWESLTGSRLFLGKDLEETAKRVLRVPIAAPSTLNADIPPELDAIVLKALEREREQRYASAAEFADALRALPGEASRSELSAWVTSTAAENLAQRLEALEELEAMDVADESGVSAASLPRASRREDDASTPATALTDDTATISSSTLFSSGGSTRMGVPKGGSFRPRPVLWALALASLALLSGVIAISAPGRSELPVQASNARVAQGSVPTEPLAAEHSPSRTTAFDAPDAPDAPASTATTISATTQEAPVPIVRIDQLPTAPLSGNAEPVVTQVHVGKLRKCSPPYRIDAAGVRRVRFECL